MEVSYVADICKPLHGERNMYTDKASKFLLLNRTFQPWRTIAPLARRIKDGPESDIQQNGV